MPGPKRSSAPSSRRKNWEYPSPWLCTPVIAVSIDFAIQLRSAADGALLSTVDVPVKGVYGLGFSPDGRFLANAAADGRVRVYAL